MSTNPEKSGIPLSKVQEFFQMVYDILKIGYLPEDSFFSTDGPDFLFEYNDEIEKEAPVTGDLIETGDFVDDMDGWQSWIHINDVGQYDQQKYIGALQRDFDEALKSYQNELNTTWKPK